MTKGLGKDCIQGDSFEYSSDYSPYPPPPPPPFKLSCTGPSIEVLRSRHPIEGTVTGLTSAGLSLKLAHDGSTRNYHTIIDSRTLNIVISNTCVLAAV